MLTETWILCKFVIFWKTFLFPSDIDELSFGTISKALMVKMKYTHSIIIVIIDIKL